MIERMVYPNKTAAKKESPLEAEKFSGEIDKLTDNLLDAAFVKSFLSEIPNDIQMVSLDGSEFDFKPRTLENAFTGKYEEKADWNFYQKLYGDIVKRLKKVGMANQVQTVMYPLAQSDFQVPYILFPDASLYILIDQKPAVPIETFQDPKRIAKIVDAEKSIVPHYQPEGGLYAEGHFGPAILGVVRDLIPNSKLLSVKYFMSSDDPETARLWIDKDTHEHQKPVHMIAQFNRGEGTKTQTIILLSSAIDYNGNHSVEWTRKQIESLDYQALILKGFNLTESGYSNIETGKPLANFLKPIIKNKGVVIEDSDYLDSEQKANTSIVPAGKKAYGFGYAQKGAKIIKY